jgi:Flp pilus assembly protein TadG
MKTRKPIWPRSRGSRIVAQHGQSMVEFAMVVPLFFLLAFGIIDLGRVFFVQTTLQNAMRQAGRFAVTGNHLTDPVTATPMSRVDSIIQVAKNAATGLDISNIQISSQGGGSTGPNRAGWPGDTVTISLTTNLKLITPMVGRFFGPSGTYKFTVSTTFRNEPFPPNLTS